jgi:hypothetical protein
MDSTKIYKKSVKSSSNVIANFQYFAWGCPLFIQTPLRTQTQTEKIYAMVFALWTEG